MSHTLGTIIESFRQDGFVAGMHIALAELYHRQRFCLLEHLLGPGCMPADAAENVKLADSSYLDKIVAAWPEEFGRAKGDEYLRRKIASRLENGYPCLISERDGRIEGAIWCTPWEFDDELRPTRDRQDAFEVTNGFVISQCRGKGVGSQLLGQALSLMAARGKRVAYGRVKPERRASMMMCVKCGFHLLGVMHSTTKFGRQRYRLVPLTRSSRGDVRGMEIPACVLLVRTAWGGALEAVRSLGSRGVPVYLFVLNRDPTAYAKSRYCREARMLVGQDAASVSRELREWCKTQRFSQRPLLLPMTDILSTFVAEERPNLEEHFIIGAARPEIIMSLLDKQQAGRLAAACGIDVPPSTVVKTHTDLEATAHTMKYPAIAKPVWWREKGSANFKALIFENPESVIARLAPVLDGRTSVFVQEYVEGTDQKIETFMFYRDRRGMVWGCTSRKLRQAPPNAGIMASGHAVDLPELRRLSKMFLNRIDYQGLGGVEFKRNGTGLKYIETSARPEAIHGLSRKAGVDLVWIAYCDYCLGGLAEEPYSQHEAFYLDWHAFWATYGLRNVIPWIVDLLRMLSKQPLKIAVFEWRDPRPSLYLMGKGLQERFGRILKKLR